MAFGERVYVCADINSDVLWTKLNTFSSSKSMDLVGKQPSPLEGTLIAKMYPPFIILFINSTYELPYDSGVSSLSLIESDMIDFVKLILCTFSSR